MAAALLTRWRPMRWLAILSLPPFLLLSVLQPGWLRGRPGWVLVDVAVVLALAILLSPPVVRCFRAPRSDWD